MPTGKEFNPPPAWMPTTLDSIEPVDHLGQRVSPTIKQPKNQYLFKILKGLSESRLMLDKRNPDVAGDRG